MNTNYVSYGFCSSQASMVVAAAVLKDFKINYSTYSGFPEVVLTYGDGVFSVRLRVGDSVVGPLVLKPEVLRKEIDLFEADKPMGRAFFRSVQELVADLEAAEAGYAKEGGRD